jgi:glycosyltransferase involved in cell wall biosynthesis
VIVTDVGELKETVHRAAMGLVVPPRDANALADAIIELGCNDELRARYAEGSRRYAETTISPQRVGQHALEFYRRATR